MGDTLAETLELLDYRRKVADLYADVRRRGADRKAWDDWRDRRDGLFATHPQSAVPADARPDFAGLHYFDHDPSLRVEAVPEPAEHLTFQVAHSADGFTDVDRVGTVRFDLGGAACTLSLYWLDQYAGGLFLPFRDATCGDETYGGGRYLLDSAKSADLGTTADGALVLDFNYAYHPSCVQDARWSCPLAPPENRLPVPVRGGERLP